MDELWECPRCPQRSKASKKMSFSQLPQILIIQLKRFNGKLKKINTLVNFPFTNLDMSPYLESDRSENCIFDLFAIVEHRGNLQNGHYTALCQKDEKKW